MEMTLPTGQVGVLDSIKLLISDVALDRMPYLSSAKIQGWNGSAWVDVWALDVTLLDGWNTKTFDAGSKPAYYKYKYSSWRTGGCKVGEIVFFGIVAVADTKSSTSCTASLVIDSTTTSLSSVTYDASITPKVNSITPRYGKVSGNELITITGLNFIPGQTTVTIDKIACTI
jgi:hypothetical protein